MHITLILVFFAHVVFSFVYDLRAKTLLSRKEKLFRVIDTAVMLVCAGLVAFAPYEPEFSPALNVMSLASIVTLVYGATHQGRLPRLHAISCVMRPVTLITLTVLWPFINGVSLFMGMVLPFSTSGLKDIGAGYFGGLAVLLIFQIIQTKRTTTQDQVLMITDQTKTAA